MNEDLNPKYKSRTMSCKRKRSLILGCTNLGCTRRSNLILDNITTVKEDLWEKGTESVRMFFIYQRGERTPEEQKEVTKEKVPKQEVKKKKKRRNLRSKD